MNFMSHSNKLFDLQGAVGIINCANRSGTQEKEISVAYNWYLKCVYLRAQDSLYLDSVRMELRLEDTKLVRASRNDSLFFGEEKSSYLSSHNSLLCWSWEMA